MEGYEPGQECSVCRGKCCRDKGCSLSPEDMNRELLRKPEEGADAAIIQSANEIGFSKLREELLALLTDSERGLYTIDYFSEPEGPCFYLRMRHKCYTFIGADAMGECVALTEKGCILSEDRRPKGGRFLESKASGQCVQHYTRAMMCEEWKPYQEVLGSIWNEYYPKMKQDGTFDRCDDAYFAWMKAQREG